jgi:hypothetical protein
MLTMVLLLYGCATATTTVDLPPDAEKQRVADLVNAIKALGDDIDPDEARRAARIAIEYSRQQAIEYDITGSPLYHNMLVNLGVRSRGLCIDWTADLKARLQEERFRTLDLHWAIANYRTTFSIEHSTVVISAPGASLQQGLVLDGWRSSGDLYWSPTLEDSGYMWEPQAEIHALKSSLEADLDNR